MKKRKIWKIATIGFLVASLTAGCGRWEEVLPLDDLIDTVKTAVSAETEAGQPADPETDSETETAIKPETDSLDTMIVNEAVASKVQPALLVSNDRRVAAVTQDGRVLTLPETGPGSGTEKWTDIISVAVGKECTIGLKSNGILVADGNGKIWDVEDESNVIAAFADNEELVCLYADGSISGNALSEWPDDVISVVFSYNTICGLRTDGTLIVANPVQGESKFRQKNVEGWSDIVSICWSNTLYGLKADGTVVTINSKDEEAIADWTDITVLFPGSGKGVIGQKSDGTLLCSKEEDAEAIAGWTDMVAIACCDGEFFGIKSDGTAITTSTDPDFDVSGWSGLATEAVQGNHAGTNGTTRNHPAANDAKLPNDPAARFHGQDHLIALENFKSGVILDEEKCYFEIVSAEETDEAYVYHYLLCADGEGYQSICWLNHITVNGYPCPDITFYKYESKYGRGSDGDAILASNPLRPARMEIPKASMDPQHADGIHSLWISLEAGHTSDYGTTLHTAYDIALYPGIRDDESYPQISQ